MEGEAPQGQWVLLSDKTIAGCHLLLTIGANLLQMQDIKISVISNIDIYCFYKHHIYIAPWRRI